MEFKVDFFENNEKLARIVKEYKLSELSWAGFVEEFNQEANNILESSIRDRSYEVFKRAREVDPNNAGNWKYEHYSEIDDEERKTRLEESKIRAWGYTS